MVKKKKNPVHILTKWANTLVIVKNIVIIINLKYTLHQCILNLITSYYFDLV
jgi:hypothetical protein